MGHHPFRLPGRSRGIGQRNRIPLIVGILQDASSVLLSNQCFIVQSPEANQLRSSRFQLRTRQVKQSRIARHTRIQHINHHRRGLTLRLQNLQGLAHRAKQLGLTQHHLGLTMPQHKGNRRRVQAHIQRQHHRVHARHGVMRLQHFRRVEQHQGHTIVLANP